MTITSGTSVRRLDDAALIDCDVEPIRTPVGIEPQGALLVVEEHDLRVRHASDNVEAYLGRPMRRVLDHCLPELAPGPVVLAVRALLADSAIGRPSRAQLADGRAVDVFAHRSGARVIVELEEVGDGERATFDGFQDDVLDTLERFQHADDVHEVLEAAISVVHELTGFDRVLAYRFELDGHGIVENERRADGLESLLGQHFPASDIPAQARALYREQWVRVIPDSAAVAVGLVPAAGAGESSAIDLSAAVLRAVSPVHLQYLRNMDVRASLSVSLVVDGELWGLIVCHDYRWPHPCPVASGPRARSSA